MSAAAGQQGQVQCMGCSTVLAYPVGAPCVRCPICQNVTAVNQVHIRCVNCSITLALPPTAQLAQCPRCRSIMAMPRFAPPPGQGRGGGAAMPPPGPQKQVVFIENPPSKDAQGNMVACTNIGVKLDEF
jgi:LSD1 subclass zinc finger protein